MTQVSSGFVPFVRIVGEATISTDQKARRSTLPKAEARRRYVALGELTLLQQMQRDAALLDKRVMAIGPFARLDAGEVAAQDGKTRGVISNAFGSQAAFQAETMALALSAAEWIEQIEYPDPAEFATDQAWVDAFFLGQAARGPRHGAQPVVDYASLWVLWLSALPYGLWSEQIARPALEEHVLWVRQLEQVLQRTLSHFDMRLRDGISLTDLACAMAHLIEGAWLNQCLTERHPHEPGEPIAAVLVQSGRMVWNGATQARERKPKKAARKSQ